MSKDGPHINTLRDTYAEAVAHEAKAESLWAQTQDYKGQDGLILAYKASARALMAKHHWNPYYKLSYLQEAMRMFNQAVKLGGGHPEVHFLRFAVQHYMPGFLGFSEHLQKDKKALLSHLPEFPSFRIPKAYALKMAEFLAHTGRCSKAELGILYQGISHAT